MGLVYIKVKRDDIGPVQKVYMGLVYTRIKMVDKGPVQKGRYGSGLHWSQKGRHRSSSERQIWVWFTLAS